MISWSPDGKKIYATNPYGGNPINGLYGNGNLLVFEAGNTAPVKTLLGDDNSRNPFAIAIQPK